MMAVIEGLKQLPEGARVVIHTDSQYVQKGMEVWMQSWKQRGWRTASGAAVKNQDLWQELEGLCQKFQMTWVWVRGHAGDEGNELAHNLAHNAAQTS